MKHRQIALAIFASLSASLAPADDFKTVSGKEYKNVTVSRVEADGIVMWQRSYGAILWLRSNVIVRLELPAAHEYETKLKAEKEQKARESVPQF